MLFFYLFISSIRATTCSLSFLTSLKSRSSLNLKCHILR